MDFMIKDNKNDKIISSAKTIDELSDGYHTFKELYDFRREYNAALVNSGIWKAHKSYRHHDGELCFGGGWFIVMINTPFGQISNHYENEYWDEFHCEEKEVADEWDGHTEKDVLNRLHYSNKWNIKDAKDGDILANDHHILILKELVYNWSSNRTPYSIKAYCGIKPNGNFEICKDNWSFCGTLHIHPATKEQRDLLFQKIKEAGYKWNAETKTLEKLVKPKFKVGDKIVDVFMKYMDTPGSQFIISEITEDKYIFTDGSYIFISRQNSWELVPDKKPKFDPKTLQPFDKVIVKQIQNNTWHTQYFSHINEKCTTFPFFCLNDNYAYCIPYNDDTKHLLGTTDEAPDYYRYWED